MINRHTHAFGVLRTTALWAALVGWLFVGLTRPVEAAEPAADELEFFEAKIRPVLVEHCFECHSSAADESKKLKGGLYLDSGPGIRNGGDSGALVTAGKPAESLLIKALRHEELEMPPKTKLPEAVIADFEAWVTSGAPVPSQPQSSSSSASIDLETGRQSWAFQLPVKHPLPPVAGGTWPKKESDWFVLAELEKRQLRPVPAASKRELIRRATFDLIGLPPTPEECDALERDEAPDAFAKVVDRLLASEHYGERWARFWLDLARYADDQGNSFLSPAPTAYLYRDWVVRALNRDMPYDEFIRLQLAGDELPGPAPDYIDRLAGLGFQGLGPVFRKGAAGEAKAKADELEDRVDTLSRGLLGLTVSCARCHDHKFDPIPTRDYYSLAAAYNGAIWGDRMLASPEAVTAHQQWDAQVKQKTAALEKWLDDQGRQLGRQAFEKIDAYVLTAWKVLVLRRHKQPADDAAMAQQANLDAYFLSRWISHLEAAKDEPALKTFRAAAERANATAMPLESQVAIPDELQSESQALKAAAVAALRALEQVEKTPADAAEKPPGPSPEQQELLKLLSKDAKGPLFIAAKDVPPRLVEPGAAQHAGYRAELDGLVNGPPPTGPVMPSVSGGGQAMQVFVRGNPAKLGEAAPPGFLRILSAPVDAASSASSSEPFTRLKLAQAIANPQNPLTARVFVNRVWHYHFGRGIVATLANFGRLGSPPTHPELLDTLAVRFVESGWSIKQLHREIMLSAAYQLSSAQNADNLAKDPDNHYLWRMAPRRLDVEAWRDAVLAVSGKLDPQIGGPSLDQKNPGVKEIAGFPGFSRLVGLDVDNPTNGRRTIYGIVSRYAPSPALVLFDFPEPNVTSDMRTSTTIPQQQLFVLNSAFMIEMARALSERLQQAAVPDEGRITLGWQLAYSRPPTADELALSLEFVRAPAATDSADKLTNWEQLCHALLTSNEFMFLP